MAQWAKVFAAKPDDLSPVPRSHMIDVSCPLTSMCVPCACASTHTNTQM